MRRRIDELAREKQFCGSLALVQNGEIVARSSYGNTNSTLSIPNGPGTQFNIGSIGKMFTAIAIAKLVADGKLAYDRPIRESLSALSHCPEYHAAIFSRLDFTPHELLTHTAGLNDYVGKIYEDSLGPDMLLFTRVEDYFHHFAPLDVQSLETRGTHRYSNLGYFLLGLTIEAITGDYYQFVKDAVFIPAGMTSTVPTRAPGDNFALPTMTAPSLPNPAPQWLVDMSRDQSDMRLSRDAHFAIIMLADIRKITEARDKLAAEILSEYQQISRLSQAEYPQFRARLSEKINLLQKITLETQKNSEALVKLIHPVCERLHKQWVNNSDTEHNLRLQKIRQLDEFLMEALVRHTGICPQLNCLLNSLSIAHPAGCWYSTVGDLIAFDQSLQHGSLSTYRTTLTDNAVPDGRVDNHYGYGCAIGGPISDPTHRLGHTGGMPGGLANYQHYPNAGYTLVMLSNEDHPDRIFGFAHEIEAVMKAEVVQAEKDIAELLMWTNSFQDFVNAYSRYFSTITDDHQRMHLANAFWKHIDTIKMPVVELGEDGSHQVYFLYRRTQDELGNNDLYIQSDFHGYGSTLSSQRLDRIGNTDVMCCTTKMVPELKDALFTYHFVEAPRSYQNKSREEIAVIPESERTTDLYAKNNWSSDPYGKHRNAVSGENQFCVNTENDLSPWREENAAAWPTFQEVLSDTRLMHFKQTHSGDITRGVMDFGTDLRSIQILKPTEPVEKIVIVNDGFAYLLCDGVNRLQEIAEREKCAFIFISPLGGLGNPNEHRSGLRGIEYDRDVDRYAAFILNQLLPELNRQGVIPDPRPTHMTVVGASTSGTGALRMALMHPDRFSQVIAHSPGTIGKEKIDAMSDVPATARKLRIDLECGQFENLNDAGNDDISGNTEALGKTLGVKVHVGKHGHQYEPWIHDLVSRSLPAMFAQQVALSSVDDSMSGRDRVSASALSAGVGFIAGHTQRATAADQEAGNTNQATHSPTGKK